MDILHKPQLDSAEIHTLLQELRPAVLNYSKDEFIRPGGSDRKMYVVLEGSVYLCTQSERDEMEITACFFKGGLFPGTLITFYSEVDEGQMFRFALCKTKCRIAAVDMAAAAGYLFTPVCTGQKCSLLEFGYWFVSAGLARHCHVLQQKSVRDKVLAYLNCEPEYRERGGIRLEIPYSDLSNYLQSDRSSLMKELSRMVADGVIVRKGRWIYSKAGKPSLNETDEKGGISLEV